MSTPRRGVRRQAPRRRSPAGRPAAATQPEAPSEPASAPPSDSGGTRADSLGRGWRILEMGGWIVLWVGAAGAGYLLGRIDIAKAVFIAVLLAATVLPWLRWVRAASRVRLISSRRAMLQTGLAILVAFVFLLSGAYVWAIALVVVEMAATMFSVVLNAPRPAQT